MKREQQIFPVVVLTLLQALLAYSTLSSTVLSPDHDRRPGRATRRPAPLNVRKIGMNFSFSPTVIKIQGGRVDLSGGFGTAAAAQSISAAK